MPGFWDSPEERSPVEKSSEVSIDDDDETATSVTEACLTKSNIARCVCVCVCARVCVCEVERDRNIERD